MVEDDAKRDITEITLSFVVPVRDDSAELPSLYRRLRSAAEGLHEPYEVIFVNDGSTDESPAIIRKLASEDEHVRYVDLSRSFGRQAALTAGVDYAGGKAVVTLDADGRHPPEVVAEMVGRWREGYEVVNAVRNPDPKVGRLRRTARGCAWRLTGWLSGVDLSDAADFRLLDRKVVGALRQARAKSRSLRELVQWVGFRQAGVPYDEPPGEAGARRCPLRELTRTCAAGAFGFSAVPLRLLALLGGAMAAAAAVYAVFALVLWPLAGGSLAANMVMLAIGLSGLQIGAMGLVGAFAAGLYEEAKDRPIYVVREAVGFDVEAKPPAEPAPPPARQAPAPIPSGRIRLFT